MPGLQVPLDRHDQTEGRDAIGCDGLYKLVTALRGPKGGATVTNGGRTWVTPEGRGDFPIWGGVALYVASTLGYTILCLKLVPGFPIAFVLFFGFIFTPINSYINARMVGLTECAVGVDMTPEILA